MAGLSNTSKNNIQIQKSAMIIVPDDRYIVDLFADCEYTIHHSYPTG